MKHLRLAYPITYSLWDAITAEDMAIELRIAANVNPGTRPVLDIIAPHTYAAVTCL